MGINNPGGGGFPFAGILLGSDGISGNFTTNVNIPWDTEAYNDGFPAYTPGSAGIVFPDGTQYGRLSFSLDLADMPLDAPTAIYLFRNDSVFEGGYSFSTAPNKPVRTGGLYLGGSAIVPISDGDVFTVNLTVDDGFAVTLLTQTSWFLGEALA